MKLETGEMILLFGEGKYEVIIGRIAQHFGLAIPVDPVISVMDSHCSDYALQDDDEEGVLAAQIWGKFLVFEWSTLYGFQSVSRAVYFSDPKLGPYRIYK